MVLEKRRKQELTKGEEEVMHILWELGKGTVKTLQSSSSVILYI